MQVSSFMWDMKVAITAGRMHNSLTQFMHFFLQKKLPSYPQETPKKAVYRLNEHYIAYLICLESMGGGRV